MRTSAGGNDDKGDNDDNDDSDDDDDKNQKVRQKHVPLSRKSASKRQKRVPLSRKSFPKRGCLVGYGRNPKMILSQCCIDFDTKTYRFGHISGPSYRGAHAGWPAGWLVGWRDGWLAGAPKCVKNVYP